MKIYQYWSQIFNANVQVRFNKHGILVGIEIMDKEIEAAHKNVHELKTPIKELDFLTSAKQHNLKVTPVTREVTFDEFWERYKQKDCGRTVAEAKWNKLSKSEQLNAFDFIPAFESILKVNSTPKPYATTYINQKRWIR